MEYKGYYAPLGGKRLQASVGNKEIRDEAQAVGKALCLFLLISLIGLVLRSAFADLWPFWAVEIISIASFLLALGLPSLLFRSQANTVFIRPKWDRQRVLQLLLHLLLFLGGYAFLTLVSSRSQETIDAGNTVGALGVGALLLSILRQVLLPAFLEEWFFRGTILKRLLPFGEQTALLISGLFFGLAHWRLDRLLPTFYAGVFLGILFMEYGSLRVCQGVHLVNNAVAFLLSYLAQSGHTSVAMGGWYVLIGLGLLSGILLLVRYSGHRLEGYVLEPANVRFWQVLISPAVLVALIGFLLLLR